MSREIDQFGIPVPLPLATAKPLAMGIAFAACCKPETLQQMLGCTLEEAKIFQETAAHDFHGLMTRAKAARNGHGQG